MKLSKLFLFVKTVIYIEMGKLGLNVNQRVMRNAKNNFGVLADF